VTFVWKNWVPGVLADAQVRQLVGEGCLMNLTADSPDIDPSAINLRLGDRVWKMTKGGVKPFGGNYEHFLNSSGYAEEIEFADPLELRTRTTYVFKLALEFSAEFRKAKCFYGHATGRSSVGRVDVLTRLIVDGMDEYEGFNATRLSEDASGKLFLEVTPITFTVAVKPDTALSQLRLFFGTPESCLITGHDIVETTLRSEVPLEHTDGVLSLSLEPEQSDKISAFCAKVEAVMLDESGPRRAPVPLWDQDEAQRPDPGVYWNRVKATAGVKHRDWLLEIQHGWFYILKSHEKLCLPAGVAVYCKPSDETIGEMRIHYAGFVHPWFGLNRHDEKEGTPLIFEVRGHDLPTVLGHKEKLARLEYYRMSQDPQKPTKQTQSPYEDQSLELSRFFKTWRK
jgi:dCTP deaminase